MSLIRTQIQLDEKQYQALKQRALQEGVSVSELIRRATDYLILEEKRELSPFRRRKIIEILGKYRSGQSDISEKHDQYFAEPFLS